MLLLSASRSMVRDTGLAVSIPAVSPANAPWHTLMVINITAARKAAILFFFFILFMASFFLLCFAVLREFLVSLVSGFFRFAAGFSFFFPEGARIPSKIATPNAAMANRIHCLVPSLRPCSSAGLSLTAGAGFNGTFSAYFPSYGIRVPGSEAGDC